MILNALALGFSTGVFCMGTCCPILAPVMLSREEIGLKQAGLSLGLFMLSRLVAYVLFGQECVYTSLYLVRGDLPLPIGPFGSKDHSGYSRRLVYFFGGARLHQVELKAFFPIGIALGRAGVTRGDRYSGSRVVEKSLPLTPVNAHL